MLNANLFLGVSLDCLPVPGTCWQFRSADPCVLAPGSVELPLQQQLPSRILFHPGPRAIIKTLPELHLFTQVKIWVLKMQWERQESKRKSKAFRQYQGDAFESCWPSDGSKGLEIRVKKPMGRCLLGLEKEAAWKQAHNKIRVHDGNNKRH